MIEAILSGMSWDYDFNPLSDYRRQRKNLDKYFCREKIKRLHMLVRHGGRWEPRDRRAIDFARNCLLKMTPDYTLEFIWIITGYNACSIESIEQLLRTPSIRSLVSNHLSRIGDMMGSFKRSSQIMTI